MALITIGAHHIEYERIEVGLLQRPTLGGIFHIASLTRPTATQSSTPATAMAIRTR